MPVAVESDIEHQSVTTEPLKRWLFVKDRFAWPRSSGHDVHTYGMMAALAELGHGIALATVAESPDRALEGIPFTARYCLNQNNPPVPTDDTFPMSLTKSQEKFRNYWGVSHDHVRQVAAAAADCEADVVVVSGLDALPYLGAIEGRARVWYAADEWVWHHLSLVRPFSRSTWSEIKPALVKGYYQRAYRSKLENVWVVTEQDARAFRRFAGIDRTTVIPNGVDGQLYHPIAGPKTANSCVFWGRLDFGPNIQALQWFVKQVWPEVRRRLPDATLNVFGFKPGPEVRSIAGSDGIQLHADVPDLRAAVSQSQIAVLPFISGGGIKNKLLEAAALGLPIVSTPRGKLGLLGMPPFVIESSPSKWVTALTHLWSDELARSEQARANRDWVMQHHTWDAAARRACAGLVLLSREHAP